jgi:hypothetical protein
LLSLGEGEAEFEGGIVVVRDLDGGRMCDAAMVTPLEGFTAVFEQPGPYPLEVQTFRMRNMAGDARRVITCADCGAVRVIGVGEVEALAKEPCAACGALPSAGGCEGWHAHGTCPRCHPTPAECSASGEQAQARAAELYRLHYHDPRRDRLAEDGQPQKAGPDASSLGSAGSGCGCSAAKVAAGMCTLHERQLPDGTYVERPFAGGETDWQTRARKGVDARGGE